MFKLHISAVLILLTVGALADPIRIDDGAAEVAADNWHLIADEAGNLNLLDLSSDAVAAAAADASTGQRFNPYVDVNIQLYTRRNPQTGQRIQVNSPAQLRGSHFNAAHPTRFVMHGWRGHGDANINHVVRHAYFARGEFNVFVVDWGAGANSNYVTSRNRVAEVGRHVALFIDFLQLTTGIAFPTITLIGHSLGAHVAGFAGKRVTRGKIQNLVALDPALPLFSFSDATTRVATTDARYVESIQTDIGRLGFDQPIGHATFYPNWGRNQPGCGVDVTGSCSHERAVEFFVESIRYPRAFYGTRCAGWASIQSRSCPATGPSMPMGGEPLWQGAEGVYFMTVNAGSPFGQGVRSSGAE